MKRIAIIGGGISGLAAAFALEGERRTGTLIEYVLFESSQRFGGVSQDLVHVHGLWQDKNEAYRDVLIRLRVDSADVKALHFLRPTKSN